MEASLPEEVLQPLLNASGSVSSSLEDCLQYLLETAKTDSGRSNLASKSILPSILRLVQLLPYPSSRHYLNLSLKVLRNLCAGEVIHQNAFVEHNGSALVSDLLISAIKDYETVRFGLQVVANVVVFGEKRQRDVWIRFYPERFLEIAKIRRRESCDPLCMVLYTCFDGSEEIASELSSNEGLSIIAETLRTSSSVGSVEDYWLKLLVSRLCVEGDCFPEIFSKLYESEDDTFTSEQAFVLRMVSDIANERIKEVSIPKDVTCFILGLFKQSVNVFGFDSGERSELPTGSTIIDVMGYSLVIIRDACAGGSLEELKNVENDSGGDSVELMLSSGLLELLLDLLRKLEPPTTIKKAMNQSPSSSTSLPSKPCPYRGFRRDIVSVIGNCAYTGKKVQDEIRERDGLFLMLQQCVTDDDNPFLREWGLWCVRNLLEGNQVNQEVVAELEMQGSVDVPQLREIGLKVEIDPKTSRPKLVNDT